MNVDFYHLIDTDLNEPIRLFAVTSIDDLKSQVRDFFNHLPDNDYYKHLRFEDVEFLIIDEIESDHIARRYYYYFRKLDI